MAPRQGVGVEIRQLTQEDAAAYRALRLRALGEAPDAFGSTLEETVAQPLSRTAERLRAQVESGAGFTLGAWAGDLVGVVTLLRHDGLRLRHKADLLAMYVAPEARGRGVARALVDELIARARRVEGLEQINLSVVSSNEPARRLYRSLGFVIYGVERRCLKIGERYLDEELMTLWLQG